MLRAAILALVLTSASCGSIKPLSGGDGGVGGAGGSGGGGTGGGGSGGAGGARADGGASDAASGDGGGLLYRGGISTLGVAPAPAATGLRVIRQGLRVPVAPVCNGTLCVSGGITQ